MPYRYNKLRGRIVEKYGSQANFARELGTTPVTISMKMCGKRSFTKADIDRWTDKLDIETDEIGAYFFA